MLHILKKYVKIILQKKRFGKLKGGFELFNKLY